MVSSSQPDTPIFPPSDLWSDEPPLETYRHLKQLILLRKIVARPAGLLCRGQYEHLLQHPSTQIRRRDFILEILSDTTAKNDRGLKKQLYQDIFRTPDYFWFDPYTLEFAGFKLNYRRYEEMENSCGFSRPKGNWFPPRRKQRL